MSDLGTDTSTYVAGDLDPSFNVLSGTRVIAEAIARRLTTPRGLLPEDTDYGYDCRALLNATLTPTALFVANANIVAEVEKDERVASAAVTFDYNPALATLRIGVQLQTLAGPFALVLDVTQAAVVFHTESL